MACLAERNSGANTCQAFQGAAREVDREPLEVQSNCIGYCLRSPLQRFGSALDLNIHFHMLFLDGVCVDHLPHGNRPSTGPQGIHAADAAGQR